MTASISILGSDLFDDNAFSAQLDAAGASRTVLGVALEASTSIAGMYASPDGVAMFTSNGMVTLAVAGRGYAVHATRDSVEHAEREVAERLGAALVMAMWQAVAK